MRFRNVFQKYDDSDTYKDENILIIKDAFPLAS